MEQSINLTAGLIFSFVMLLHFNKNHVIVDDDLSLFGKVNLKTIVLKLIQMHVYY